MRISLFVSHLTSSEEEEVRLACEVLQVTTAALLPLSSSLTCSGCGEVTSRICRYCRYLSIISKILQTSCPILAWYGEVSSRSQASALASPSLRSAASSRGSVNRRGRWRAQADSTERSRARSLGGGHTFTRCNEDQF